MHQIAIRCLHICFGSTHRHAVKPPRPQAHRARARCSFVSFVAVVAPALLLSLPISADRHQVQRPQGRPAQEEAPPRPRGDGQEEEPPAQRGRGRGRGRCWVRGRREERRRERAHGRVGPAEVEQPELALGAGDVEVEVLDAAVVVPGVAAAGAVAHGEGGPVDGPPRGGGAALHLRSSCMCAYE